MKFFMRFFEEKSAHKHIQIIYIYINIFNFDIKLAIFMLIMVEKF